jgi:hypothetical protein
VRWDGSNIVLGGFGPYVLFDCIVDWDVLVGLLSCEAGKSF